VQRDPVTCSFLKNGIRLYWVTSPDTMDEAACRWLRWAAPGKLGGVVLHIPIEHGRRLIVAGDHWWKPVSWPSDLTGLVHLQSSAQALEYVRLFSSRETWYKFPEFGFMEIKPAGEGTLELDAISRSEFERFGLRQVEVAGHGGSYRIRRPVVRVDALRWRLMSVGMIDEEVRADGAYALRILWEDQLTEDTMNAWCYMLFFPM
jgi:hypothetical protein